MKWSSTFKGLLLTAGLLLLAPRLCAREPLASHFGIGTFLHPVQKPESLHYPECCLDKSCSCCKEHVYIFAVNGLNPLCLGNFNGFCDYLREEGFENTYFHHIHTCWGVGRQIRQIRCEDPEARIVVIGFSAGCWCARCLADSLARDGTRVDLLVYLSGDYVKNTPRWHPDNVCRVLNVRAKGLIYTGGDLFFNGADLDGARNCRLEIRHILTPSHPDSVALVMEELLALSCVPCATPAGEALPAREGNLPP